MCGAPAQTPTLPAGIDIEKETVPLKPTYKQDPRVVEA